LNFDLEGNCYLCHNSPTRIGTVNDSYETLVEAYKTYDPYTTGPDCQTCPVLPLCGGGCLLVSRELRKQYYCPMACTYYGAIRNAIIRAGKTIAERKTQEEKPAV
jgi:radical SAM protein with 4Fe4S-binding SPASM domain